MQGTSKVQGRKGDVAEAHRWGGGGDCVNDSVTKDGGDLDLGGQDERLIIDGLDNKVVVPHSVHVVPGATEEPLHAKDWHPVLETQEEPHFSCVAAFVCRPSL